MVVQRKDDKKKKIYEPFKIRYLMLDLDEYMRVFILPQIPAEYKDFRGIIKSAMDKAWHEVYYAAQTTARVRQNHLMALKVELMVMEVYLQEVRDVCYRGKKKLDNTSARRFEVCARKQAAVMELVWAWIHNEDAKMPVKKSQKVAGLTEGEDGA